MLLAAFCGHAMAFPGFPCPMAWRRRLGEALHGDTLLAVKHILHVVHGLLQLHALDGVRGLAHLRSVPSIR